MRVQDGLKALRRLWPVALACGLLASTVMWLITPVAINTERQVASFQAIATLLVSVQAPLEDVGRAPGSPARASNDATPTPTGTPSASASATARSGRTPTPTSTPTPSPSATSEVSEGNGSLALNRVALLVTTGEIPHLAAQDLGHPGNPAVLAEQVQVEADGESGSVTISMTSKDSRSAVETVNAFAHATVAFFEGPGRETGVEVLLLEEATALPNETTDAYVAPPSKWGRTLIAGVVGLVLGLGLILFVARLDPRLRTRHQVASALALPVFAEIPRRRRGRAGVHQIAIIDAPRSAEADGYRVLRSSILHDRAVANGTRGRAYVIVVTSLAGGADEVLVNVAAGLAGDLRVLAVDGDLRNPGLEAWFDVPFSQGLSDYLTDASTDLDAVARPARIPGVRVLTAGSLTSQPIAVISQIGRALAAAEGLADVIIVKAPPLLAASEVFDLLPHANMVLIAVRSGHLERPAAERAKEMLHRFPHADAGVVLIGAQEGLFGIASQTRRQGT